MTIVELSDRGTAVLPALTATWQRLAEQSVDGLASTLHDQLTAALADLAACLTSTGAAANEQTPLRRNIS